MAQTRDHMKFCPECGQTSVSRFSKSFACRECGFTLFLNAAAAVAAIIEYDGSILATVRACSPDAGRLDLPGGFVDNQETAEQALGRELKEELSLQTIAPVYFGSYPNLYPYKARTYHTLDLIFTVKLMTLPSLAPADDVASIRWIKTSELEVQDFAFSSVRSAVTDYLNRP